MFLGNIDKVVSVVVFAREVYHTILNQVVQTLGFALLDRVKNWRLTLVIHEVWVTSSLNEFLHDLDVSLPR